MKLPIKYLSILFISCWLIINFVFLYQHQDIYSTSAGDKYYHQLKKWYAYAQSNNWDKATKLEENLDKADIRAYKYTHLPQQLAENLADIYQKKTKTLDDWYLIAQIEAQLDHIDNAKQAIKEAYALDPIRSDIEKLYFTFQNL